MIKQFDIKGLCDILPHENQTQHKPYQEYYGATEKAIIDELFDEDFTKLFYRQVI